MAASTPSYSFDPDVPRPYYHHPYQFTIADGASGFHRLSRGQRRRRLAHNVSIDSSKAAGTLHIYVYGYISNDKDGNHEWNRPRALQSGCFGIA